MSNNSEHYLNEIFINSNCENISVDSINARFGNFNSNFSAIMINIRSLPSNYVKLLAFLTNINVQFSLIILCETWLDDCIDKLYDIPSYFHRSVHRNRHGGGIRIYYKTHINVFVLEEDTGIYDTCEILSIKIKIPNITPITCCCIYRPPSSDKNLFIEFIDEKICHGPLRSENSFIIGDFNFDFYKRTELIVAKFYNMLFSNSFKVQITCPTYIKPNTLSPSSIIDQICTKTSYSVSAFVIDNCISDHLPIYFHLNLIVANPIKTIKFRNFSSIKIDNFVDNLNIINLSMPSSEGKTSDEALDEFSTWCTFIANRYFPICNKTISNKNCHFPWISRTARKCIRVRDRLRFLSRSGYVSLLLFLTYDKILNKLLKRSRLLYYQNLFNGNISTKKTWNLINKIIGNSKSHSTYNILLNDTISTDPIAVAEYFNDYFSNIPANLVSSLSYPSNDYMSLIPFNNNSMYLEHASSGEIFWIIKSLKNNTSIANIPIKMLKLSEIFSVGLANIFNIVVDTGIYPKSLKSANITPIYKSGSKNKVENYRPIAILPVFDKIFEKLLSSRLYSFLKKSKIIGDTQFGFVKGCSTFSAIECLLSHCTDAFKNNDYTLTLFADLSKAFDCVNIELLLLKLYRYGIRGVVHKLFSSFLSNRTQKVVINGYESSTKTILLGVPQGSCLGPILFLLYINDLPNLFKTIPDVSCLLYADDTTVLYRSDCIHDVVAKINSCLTMFWDWLLFNKLTLNVTKTKYMIFTNRHLPLFSPVCIGGVPLICTDSYKYLGVNIDNKLKYNCHLESIISKLNMYLSISSKISHCFSLNAARSFYYSHIYSSITYGICYWGSKLINSGAGNSLSKKHINVICNLFWRFYSPYCCKGIILKNCNLLNICDIYKFKLSCMFYQSLLGRGSVHLADIINKSHSQNIYFTRSYGEIQPPFCRVDALKFNYINQAFTIWRDLPISIRSLQSFSIFKKKLTEHFCSYYCKCTVSN